MSFTKTQILAEVRSLLNEPAAEFWTDEEIGNWIDQAVVDISTKTLCVETTGDIELGADTAEYDFPTGALKVVACLYDGRGLLKIRPHQVGHVTERTKGKPEYWYPFAKKIGVFPVPDSTRAGEKMTVYYHKMTYDITLIPDEFQLLAIQYAVRNALMKDRKWASAAQMNGIYLNNAGFGRQDLILKPGDAKEDYRVPDYKAMVTPNA